jgi:isochorismate pyruvate lyase
MTDVPPPDDCTTMAQVRAGVDATDRALVALMERRFGYMRAAARIKDSRESVRDETRKAQVLANIGAECAARDLPARALVAIWDDLVEASIAYELAEWDRLRTAAASQER